MCEYCIEEIILKFIPRTIFYDENNQEIAIIIPDAYMQESDSLEDAIKIANKCKYYHITRTTFLCRMIETIVFKGYDQNLYIQYKNLYHHSELKNRPLYKNIFNIINDKSTYSSLKNWTSAGKILTQKIIKSTLEYYIEWWIDEMDAQHRDNNKIVLQKIEDFENIFPATYYSLCQSIKHGQNIKLIEKIALKCPGLRRPSQYAADDLWLQRRALHACIAKKGSHFLISNIADISENHIHYILAKFYFSIAEIYNIKERYISTLKNSNDPDITSQLLIENLSNIITKYHNKI